MDKNKIELNHGIVDCEFYDSLKNLIRELTELHMPAGNEALGITCTHCYPYYEPTYPCHTMRIVVKYRGLLDGTE